MLNLGWLRGNRVRQLICLLALLFGLQLLPVASAAQSTSDLIRSFRADELTQADKRFLQTALAFEGHYIGLLDGAWGPLSQSALERYSLREFGTGAEDWHMAALAFGFFEIYERDGWEMRHFDGLGMSMLHPFSAVVIDPPSDNFVNWRHINSSLSFSVGVHATTTAQRLHDYAVAAHNSPTELYSMRRRAVAVTRATRADSGVLYVRSNYINGAWSTIMLSVNGRDVPILNAVAASISVGYAPPISVTVGGKLESVILRTAALVSEQAEADQTGRDTSSGTLGNEPAPVQQTSSGTGFVVSREGHILTNAHVVKGCTALKFDGHSAEVVAVSDDFDLALLHSSDWQGSSIATFSPSPARLNSDVTVVGYPLVGILSGLNVTRGSVSSQMGFGGQVGGMQITAPVQPGNSGGPVLAEDGEVVGVVVGKLNAQFVADETGDIPQNVNFAIRGELAKLFLFQHGIEPSLGTSDEPVSPVELADAASEFTGLIECN